LSVLSLKRMSDNVFGFDEQSFESLFLLGFMRRSNEMAMNKLLIVGQIMKRVLLVEAIGLMVILTGIVVMMQQIP